mgnify:CR=1 FL=1
MHVRTRAARYNFKFVICITDDSTKKWSVALFMSKRECVNNALLSVLSFIILLFGGQHMVLAAEVTAAPMPLLLAQAEFIDPARRETPVDLTGAAQSNNAANLSDEAPKEVEVVVDVPVKDEASMLDDFKFSLAPIQFGGDVSAGISRQSYIPGRTFSRNFSAVNLRAATYIWQPWFAQLNGGVGVISGKNYTGNQSLSDTSVVGNGSLAMFQQSRFPFSASHTVSDSRTNSAALTPNINFTTKSTNVRQSYRPLSGSSDTIASYNRNNSTILPINSQVGRESVGTRYNLQHEQRLPGYATRFGLSYDYNNLNIAASGNNLVIAKQANVSTQFSNQSLRADVRRNESKFNINSTNLQSHGSTLSHTYRPSSLFSLTTLANYDKTKSLALIDVSNRFLQAYTTAAWQPDADLPLFLSASGNFFDSKLETINPASIATPRTEFISKSRTANLNASYNANRNVSYALAGVYANTRAGLINNHARSGSGSASYRADMRQFGIAFYNWNANTAAVATSNTTQPSAFSLSAGLGHTLNAPQTLRGGSTLDLNAAQSLLVRDSRLNGRSISLSNNAGVSWRPLAGETTSGSVSFSVADIRIDGGDNRNHYQTVTLGVDAFNRSSVNSSASGMATLQWASNGEGQITKSANASIGYQHARAFDMQGLRYSLALSVLHLDFENTVTQINQLNRRSGSTLEQSLDYRLGRAFLRLNGTISRFTDFKSSSIFVLVGRNFGSI